MDLEVKMRKFVNADDASADFDDFIKMLVVIIVILFATAWSVTYIVPHGNVGVYERLGVIDHIEKEPGLYFTLPWARIIDYSVQTQEYEFKEIKGTLTQEGLEFKFDASILYSIQPDKASEIRESISGDYFETIIVPSFSSIAREEIKRWLIEDIYSGKSTDIQEDIFIRLKEEVAPRGINIESVYIRATGLPPLIKQAIENKITEKQAVEQMNFTVQKEIAMCKICTYCR